MNISHVPTSESRAEVSALVAFGIPQINIAKRLGISDETLRKYYEYEIENGTHDAVATVANILYQKCVEDRDLTAIIFFLKTRGKWREKDKDEDKVKSEAEQFALRKV